MVPGGSLITMAHGRSVNTGTQFYDTQVFDPPFSFECYRNL